MKHLFVPYEIAKLAKEKGFDEGCLCFFKANKTLNKYTVALDLPYQNTEDIFLAAPLYQQLIDWFREKHKIHVDIGWEPKNNGEDIPFKTILWWSMISIIGIPSTEEQQYFGFDDPYKALNKAIEEAFKLI